MRHLKSHSTIQSTLWIAGFIMLSSVPLQAREKIPLSEYLETEVNQVNEALIASETRETRDEKTWYFRRIWMRLRPRVDLTVEIAKIGIIPEIELLWERPLPQGWQPYKP